MISMIWRASALKLFEILGLSFERRSKLDEKASQPWGGIETACMMLTEKVSVFDSFSPLLISCKVESWISIRTCHQRLSPT